MTELTAKVIALLDAPIDARMKADLVIDVVARGLGKMGGRPKKPVSNGLGTGSEPVMKPVEEERIEVSKPVSNRFDNTAQESLNVRATDPDPDPDKRDPDQNKGGVGGMEAKRAKKTDPDFAKWYGAYPRKAGIMAAWRAWQRLKTSGELPALGVLLEALEWQRRQPGWTKDGGAFVPHPSTYLNGHRWADQRPGGGSGPPSAPSMPPVAQPAPFTPPTDRGWRRSDEGPPPTFGDLVERARGNR